MWIAIIASAATIAAALYMEGATVALVLTTISSLTLLIVLRSRESKAPAKMRLRPLEIIDGNHDVDILFPPLRRQVS